MATSSKQLREQRAELSKKMQDTADLLEKEQRGMKPEEKEAWKKLNDDYATLTERIQIVERAETAKGEQESRATPPEKPSDKPTPGRDDFDGSRTDDKIDTSSVKQPTEEVRALAFQGWCLRQSKKSGLNKRMTEDHRKAATACGIDLDNEDFEFQLRSDYPKFRRESRALSGQLDAAGGFTIPEGFVSNLERAMLEFGGMRQVATVLRTTGGEEMIWPTSNDTTNTGALTAENATVTEQDVTFGAVLFHAYNYTSKMVRVPVTLIQDSAFNLASVLGDILGERLGRIGNTHFTTGTGAGQPKGVITAAATTAAAAATSISWDDLFKLIHSVDPSYRSGSGVGFMMHDTICRDIRLIKDGNGRYLWVDSVQLGKPDTILGYPVTINQDMASTIAAANKTVLFGQLSKYYIRDVGSVRVRRLVERYADSDQEAFVAFMRFDGNLLDAGVAPLKVLLH